MLWYFIKQYICKCFDVIYIVELIDNLFLMDKWMLLTFVVHFCMFKGDISF